jgi:hypothetical protein
MKSHITVILKSSVKNIEESLKTVLEAHRLNEDDIESIRAHHWDYWYFFNTGNTGDSEVRKKYPEENSDLLNSAYYVKSLPNDYKTSGVILTNGRWIDLQDFGWRMTAEPSEENSNSIKIWMHELEKILSENKNEICVQIIIHC